MEENEDRILGHIGLKTSLERYNAFEVFSTLSEHEKVEVQNGSPSLRGNVAKNSCNLAQ